MYPDSCCLGMGNSFRWQVWTQTLAGVSPILVTNQKTSGLQSIHKHKVLARSLTQDGRLGKGEGRAPGGWSFVCQALFELQVSLSATPTNNESTTKVFSSAIKPANTQPTHVHTKPISKIRRQPGRDKLYNRSPGKEPICLPHRSAS